MKEEGNRIRRYLSSSNQVFACFPFKRLVLPRRTFETVTLGLFSAVSSCLCENSHVVLHRVWYKSRQEPEENKYDMVIIKFSRNWSDFLWITLEPKNFLGRLLHRNQDRRWCAAYIRPFPGRSRSSPQYL